MDEEIDAPFVAGKILKIAEGSQMFTVEDDGKEPGEWKVAHLADAGTSEEFVPLFSVELMELVDACHIRGAAREELKQAILKILTEGLMPANELLKRIRASVDQQVSLTDRMQLYEDFSRALWHAYKDLMPRAALLLGFDIGFIFQKESAFKRKAVEFETKHPGLLAPNLGTFFQRQRKGWQSDLARFRNQFLDDRLADPIKFAAFYRLQNAEMLFSLAWGVMANVFPIFIEANFPPGLTIEMIREEERNRYGGKRFRYLAYDPPVRRRS